MTDAYQPEIRWIDTADGLALRCQCAGTGSPALIFIHGWACDSGYWSAQLQHLAPRHRVIALDLGGHGESRGARADWSMAAFASDVVAVADGLALDDLVLVGHSMGGPIIVEAARQLAGRVRGLVAVEAFHEVDNRVSPDKREVLVAAMRADIRAYADSMVRRFMFPPTADPALVDRVAEAMAAVRPEVGVAAMADFIQYGEAAGLDAVAVPVNLVNGEHWPTDLDAARRCKPGIGLTVLPGVGHFPMLEDTEGLNQALESAIARVTAP